MSSTTKLSPAAETHLPGEAGVWMFIIGDMLMFSLLFSVFVYYRSDDVALFSTSQQALSQTYGLFNTILMLTSSWLQLSLLLSRFPLRTALSFKTRRLSASCFTVGAVWIPRCTLALSRSVSSSSTATRIRFWSDS